MARRTLPPQIRGGKGKPGAVANMIKGAFGKVILTYVSGRNTNTKVYRIVHVPNSSKYSRGNTRTTKKTQAVQIPANKKKISPVSITRNNTTKRKQR